MFDVHHQHLMLTRRFFLRCSAAGSVVLPAFPAAGEEQKSALQPALDGLDTWLTRQDDFQDVSRGKPKPHSLDDAARQAAGLTRDTWKLEVISDPEDPARIRQPLTAAEGTAFTFADLMKLAATAAVRFPKIMTCLNVGCPLGNGIWEGVPLKTVLWITQPQEKLRRIHYYGFHNDDPKQIFRSSLPAGRVLEDLYGLPPVILCYKLNGDWLTPERGGPVRVVVPEAYGFKSIKWLSHVVLSNRWNANDTYGEQQNDVDSPMKTFCETLFVPPEVPASSAIPISGYAQVGISGLKKVQVWIQKQGEKWSAEDPWFASAPWIDAQLLDAPDHWGGDLPDNRIPRGTAGFNDESGRPEKWPLPLTKVHWAVLAPGLDAGDYILRCRTIDANDNAQPMPRPFRKSGRAAIHKVRFSVR